MGPKEQIIQTALEMIGQEGVQKVTTREIAKRAGVNIAAVNYHFGSKDNLIKQAMEVFIRTLNGTYALLASEETAPADRLLAFLKRFSEVSILYPGVTKSLVSQMMFAETENPVLAAAQRRGIDTFAQTLRQVTGIEDQSQLLSLSLQMMSAVLYPVLIHKQLPALYDFNFADAGPREAYIESLYRRFIDTNPG